VWNVLNKLSFIIAFPFNDIVTYDVAEGKIIQLKCSDAYAKVSLRTGGEADHSPPSRAEVMDAWSFLFTPPHVCME
jgi:hypothetical protein